MLVSAFCGLDDDAARLCACDRGGLSLLFLRRRLPAVPRRDDRRPSPSTCIATDGAARRGEIATPHGTIAHAGVHAGRHAGDGEGRARPTRCARTGADIVLGNTYHLMLRPGAERIARARRPAHVHELAAADPDRFRRLPGDVAVASCARSTSEGVTFRSHIDGAMVELTPERADRDPDAARRRHRHAARRMHQAAGAARPRSSAPCGCRSPGRSAASARSRARRRAARCSASCRAATIRRCARESARALIGIGFRRLRHRRARGRRAAGTSCCRSSRTPRRRCRPTGRAT